MYSKGVLSITVFARMSMISDSDCMILLLYILLDMEAKLSNFSECWPMFTT